MQQLRLQQLRLTVILSAVVATSVVGCRSARVSRAEVNRAAIPAPRRARWWRARHQALSKRASAERYRILFVGDSITDGWHDVGAPVWRMHYGNHALNFGLGGDRTEHLLWRLEHSDLSALGAQVVVVLIGTNNLDRDSPQQVAQGVARVVATIHKKLPGAQIVLLSIFPRGESPNPLRRRAAAASRIARRLCPERYVHHLDIGARFVGRNGRISPAIMPDFLHLSARGYALWAKAMAPTIATLLGRGSHGVPRARPEGHRRAGR